MTVETSRGVGGAVQWISEWGLYHIEHFLYIFTITKKG